jgi:hypothetical protein
MTPVETTRSNGYTTIFAKHVASVLAIPEKMFKLACMNLLPGMMVHISLQNRTTKFSCREKSVNKEQGCSGTLRATYQVLQLFEKHQATEIFSTQTLLAHRYVLQPNGEVSTTKVNATGAAET